MTDKNIQRERVKLWRKNIQDGTDCLEYHRDIKTWVKERKITTLLDYGSGKGLQYEKGFHNLIGVRREDIDLYDIGSTTNGKLPLVIYEGIIAVNVFNYLPDDFIEEDLIELFRRGGDIFAVIPLNSQDPLSLQNRSQQWWDEVFESFDNHSTVIYYNGRKRTKKVFHGSTRIG